MDAPELAACVPRPLRLDGFNPKAVIPYGLTVEHIARAMQDWLDFIGFVNGQLRTRMIPRLETFLMAANFSSIVGEFISATVPKYCPGIAKNTYHNGHPDVLPRGVFPRDAAQHCDQGIEVKGSRYLKGWQGHNAEDCWLLVFVFDANSVRDLGAGIPPRPFGFIKAVGAPLCRADWKFAGRSAKSRRTITASVRRSGYDKMEANWIYRDRDAEATSPPVDDE